MNWEGIVLLGLKAPGGFMIPAKSTEYLEYEESFRAGYARGMDAFHPPVPTTRSAELKYVGPEELSLLIQEVVHQHRSFMMDFWTFFNELNEWRESVEMRFKQEKNIPRDVSTLITGGNPAGQDGR